jgi:hypothetical protein
MKSSNHGGLTNWNSYSIQLYFLKSINYINQISFETFLNWVIQIALKCLKLDKWPQSCVVCGTFMFQFW